VTVSIGVACGGRDGESLMELIEAADGALYAAKAAGRDRVALAPSPACTG
jgi:diguanylate cyclase (GGDEF)-like protein